MRNHRPHRSSNFRLAAQLARIERRLGEFLDLERLLDVERSLFAIDRLEHRQALALQGWTLRALPYAKGRHVEQRLRMCAPRSPLGSWSNVVPWQSAPVEFS